MSDKIEITIDYDMNKKNEWMIKELEKAEKEAKENEQPKD